MAAASATPTSQRTPRGSGGTPLSPGRMTRLQEKLQLRDLNDRLAQYIDTVRSLEGQNSGLRLQLGEQEEVRRRELSGLRSLYEAELADTRRSLDDSSKERAWLQIELGRVTSEHEQLLSSYNKKDSELTGAQGRLKDLEAQLNSKDGVLATALSEKRGLESSVAELQEQLQELEAGLSQAKKHLGEEMLLRVDLENRCQSLTEEMDFRKSMHKEEVKEVQQRYEASLVEVDSGRKEEYEHKLTESLADMRAQTEQQLRVYKDNLESTYATKLEDLQRLSEGNAASAGMAREELRESALRIESLGSQLAALHKETSGWRERISELEQALMQEKRNSQKLLAEKDQQVAEFQDKMLQQLDEYEQLLDVKLALDMEINAYCKLLEGEEERLKMSPTPSSRVTVSKASSSHTVRSSRGKRKRLDVEEQEASSSVSIAHSSSVTGVVSIDEVDTDGKFICLHNTGEQDQPLGGYELVKTVGTSTATYKFTPKYVLKGGHKVKIWACDAGVSSRPPADLVWKNHTSWFSGEDLRVVLINPDGEEVAKRATTYSATAPEEEEDVSGVQAVEERRLHQQGGVPSAKRGCSIM